MNNKLKQVLLIYLRNELEVSWENDTNEVIVKKSVYNECLRDIADFVEEYCEGRIEPSFIEELEKRQQGN